MVPKPVSADRDTLAGADVTDILSALRGRFDLIFLSDVDRPAYVGYAPHLARLLRPGGLWVTDHAVSHAGEMAAFVTLAETDAGASVRGS